MTGKSIVIIFLGDIRFDSRCLKIIKTIVKQEFDITVLMTSQKSAISPEDLRLYPEKIKKVFIRLKSKKNHKQPFLKYYLKSFLKILSIKADMYFASDLYSLPIASFASIIHRSKLFYDSRELYSNIAALKNKKIKQKIWSLIEKIFIKK